MKTLLKIIQQKNWRLEIKRAFSVRVKDKLRKKDDMRLTNIFLYVIRHWFIIHFVSVITLYTRCWSVKNVNFALYQLLLSIFPSRPRVGRATKWANQEAAFFPSRRENYRKGPVTFKLISRPSLNLKIFRENRL